MAAQPATAPATGKKKQKKTKGVTLHLNEFLDVGEPGISLVLQNKDWAAEMEEEGNDDFYDGYGGSSVKPISRTQLPSAPRAAREGEAYDMDKLPSKPPYTAFVGNLPYDVNEDDIQLFFKDLTVKSVRLPNDGGRYKGFGYAEFEDRAALVEALGFNDELMRARKVRVDLADQNQQGDERGSSNRSGEPDRTDNSDWRRNDDPAPAPAPDSSRGGGGRDDRDRGGFSRDSCIGGKDHDKDSDRGGFDRDGPRRDDNRDRFSRDSRDSNDDRRDNRRGYGGDRDRGFGGDRDRGSYGDRDRGGYGDRDRGSYGDRDRGGYGGDRDRGFGGGRRDDRDDRDGGRRQFGSGFRSGGGGGGRDDRYNSDRGSDRDRYSDRRGGDRYSSDRDSDRYRRSDDDRGKPEEQQDDGLKERPKLNLKPRTKPVEETSSKPKPKPEASSTPKSSIFGSAKPVDTAQREREIEERLRKKQEDAEEKENRERKRDREMQYRDIRLTEGPVTSNRGGSHRSDKSEDSTEDKRESRRERKSSSGSTSGKGIRTVPPPTTRRDSDRDHHPRRDSEKSNHSDVFEDEKKSPAKPMSPRSDEPPAKLIPAPPPKENIWDRRRTENQQPDPEPKSDPRPAENDKRSSEDRPRGNDDRNRRNENEDRRRDYDDRHNDDRRRETSNQKETKSPEAAPTSNAWSRGKPNIEADSRKAMPETEPSKDNAWTKRSQDRADHDDGGRGGGRDGQGGHGAPRGGRGGGGDRGGRRDRGERPAPKSIDDMPKLEEKESKDFADSNKFSQLIEDDDNEAANE